MNIEEGIIKAKAILDNHREIDKMMVIEMVELVETLLTAYEKEKETSHYNQSQLDIANAKLVEEKEKNKELERKINHTYKKMI